MTFNITSYCLKNIWLIILAIILLAGCAKKDKKPADILSHEQMVKALVHVYAAEQKMNIGLSVDSANVVFKKIEGRIFDDMGIPDSVFNKSYDYYMERPKEFELIYTALVDTLNLYEQRLNVTHPTAEKPK
jgi:hypothetical protein